MGRRSVEEIERAKREILTLCQLGRARNYKQATRKTGIPDGTADYWTRRHREWYLEVLDAIRLRNHRGDLEELPTLVDFRKDCLGFETFKHQQEWFDAIDSSDAVLILVPPEFSKTTCMEDYLMHRIIRDQTVRTLYVSKTQVAARKRVYRIASHLSDRTIYTRKGTKDPIMAWGPFQPGAEDRARTWAKDMIYTAKSDPTNRDATLEALGVQNQIQGSRADVIILDDVATLENQQSELSREKILDWMGQEVLSRLPPSGGKLVIIGTRVHEQDIYTQLLEAGSVRDEEGREIVFRTIVHPAIVDDEKGERSLWPEYWPLERLIARREHPLMNARRWALVYQQKATGMPDAPFQLDVLEASKTTDVTVGEKSPHLHVVMGVDPAMSSVRNHRAGTAAIVVVGLDRSTGIRWILDCITAKPRTTDQLRVMIYQAAVEYGVRECKIESNAMQGYIAQDPQITGPLQAIGVHVSNEFTHHSKKFDDQWGVSSVAALFESGKYKIPWAGPTSKARMQPFIDELGAWRPGAKGLKQDRVMALWFAELAIRDAAVMGDWSPMPDPRVPEWKKRRGWNAPEWVRHRRTRTQNRRTA